MSVRRTRGTWWPGALLAVCGMAVATDAEAPEMEFLEYLGMWEESDDEWLVFADADTVAVEADERIDPVPEGEESTENDDES